MLILPHQVVTDCTVVKPSTAKEPAISAVSISFALNVFASRIRWTRAGIVIARGAQSNAPTSPRNLSILSAIVIEIITVSTTTIVLSRLFIQ